MYTCNVRDFKRDRAMVFCRGGCISDLEVSFYRDFNVFVLKPVSFYCTIHVSTLLGVWSIGVITNHYSSHLNLYQPYEVCLLSHDLVWDADRYT